MRSRTPSCTQGDPSCALRGPCMCSVWPFTCSGPFHVFRVSFHALKGPYVRSVDPFHALRAPSSVQEAPSCDEGAPACAQGPIHVLNGPFLFSRDPFMRSVRPFMCSGAFHALRGPSCTQKPSMHSGAPWCAQGSVAHFSPALKKQRGSGQIKWAKSGLKINPIRGRGDCFHPPLRFFGDISETAGATRLKFSDFS